MAQNLADFLIAQPGGVLAGRSGLCPAPEDSLWQIAGGGYTYNVIDCFSFVRDNPQLDPADLSITLVKKSDVSVGNPV